jgi:hypothetical protein
MMNARPYPMSPSVPLETTTLQNSAGQVPGALSATPDPDLLNNVAAAKMSLG